MSHELICNWLGLPPDVWPPDHYCLLGLTPGEGDVALIEQRVHQKLDSVRCYQMLHPEQATEAMTRLAEAFICLTEPARKQAYDQTLLGDRRNAAAPEAKAAPPLPAPPGARPAVVVPTATPPPPSPAPPPEPRDPLVWLYTPNATGPTSEVPPPPPVRIPPPPPPPPPPGPSLRSDPATVAPPPPPPPPAPPSEPVDTVVEAAQTAPQAQRGLSTRRALYHRVARTRQLLRLWHRLGKHLSDHQKRLGKQEAGDVFKLVKEIEETLEGFPLLGEAGQPGYLIVSLAQLDKARALQSLVPSQRESLARDWKAGLKFLEAHRDYLRYELRANRRRGLGERMLRAARAYLNEQPWAALVLLIILAALSVALWRSYLTGG
jgi:hypothetical protein